MIRAAGALLLFLASAAACAEVTLATWNIAWLRSAPLEDAGYRQCKSLTREAREQLDERHPMRWICRSQAHYDALAKIAARVDADVVALQEVESVEAIERVFPRERYQALVTGAPWIQRTGFAVKRRLAVTAFADYAALAQPMFDHHRTGADLTVREPDGRTLRILTVHLKSACHARPLTDRTLDPRDKPDATPACIILGAQVAPLEAWIDARAREGAHFAVLGDFNRRLDAAVERDGPARDPGGRQRALWKEIDDGDPPGLRLVRVTDGRQQIRNCRPSGPQIPTEERTMFIDHVVLGPTLAARMVPESVRQWSLVEGKITRENRAFLRELSDHCPLSVRLR